MSAAEIGELVERHHLGVTKIMEKLKRNGYVDFETIDKRYYFIKDNAIKKFFECSWRFSWYPYGSAARNIRKSESSDNWVFYEKNSIITR